MIYVTDALVVVQVKKVIRDMTLGKDVSGLFTSVVNCMMVPNLEVRKLVYLYLINYAKTQPDLAIMAVNGFVKDCGDPNPLIRALAVRTMGCIRVEQISEYLCEPLRRALKDQDPYVRKTAAITVAKLYEISPELVVDQGFIDTLNELLGDGNPMVVCNAIAALAEIAYHGEPRALVLTNITVLKLLAVLNEASEWGQIFILDVMSTYAPESSSEAENMAERVKPRLQHANSAVVLSATKVAPSTPLSLQDLSLKTHEKVNVNEHLVNSHGWEVDLRPLEITRSFVKNRESPSAIQIDVSRYSSTYRMAHWAGPDDSCLHAAPPLHGPGMSKDTAWRASLKKKTVFQKNVCAGCR